jgi:HSP20 family protein
MPFSLYTNEENHIVQIALPGVNPEDIKVFVERNELVIQAKRDRPKGTLIVRELPNQAIEKRFSLDTNIDTSSIKAEYKDGQLSLTIAKRSQRIDVQIA